jgi:TolB-like protein/Tfp pilus assembly protein PilF
MAASRFSLLKELRRRRVFRVAGLYVVAAWLALQAANIAFPAWGIPDQAIRYLILAALLGFPLALIFGWVFDISTEGIRRTQPVSSEDELLRSLPLRRTDYLILAAFLVVVGAIVYDTTGRVLRTPATTDEWHPSVAEIEPHSVAVLPFASLSADPEQEYFADGISEEILNRLAAFRELKVIARTSSFVFKDSGYDVARISGLLAVNYLLQGSVRRDGERLRIAAQLVDRTGVQVWSSTFDRELGGIFVLQDEIAEAVATSIVPQIVPPAIEHREPDLEAYREYLVGRDLVARRPSLWYETAAERFTRAIELDPEFAAPYAARAAAVAYGVIFARDRDAELARAQQDVDTALKLDPNLAYAYAAQALVSQRREPMAHAEREALLRKALALDPNLVDALNWLSGAIGAQQREDEALEVLQRAARIDPLSPIIIGNLARNEARRGRFEDAERRLRRALDMPHPSAWPSAELINLYAHTGRMIEATAAAKQMMIHAAAATGKPGGVLYLTYVYSALGMWDAADYWQTRKEQAWPGVYQLRLHPYMDARARYTPAELLAGMEDVLQAAGIAPDSLDADGRSWLGEARALAGQHAGARALLESIVVPGVARSFGQDVRARHALAWAWQQSGAGDQAHDMLGLMDAAFRREEAAGRLHVSWDICDFARNTLLLGKSEGALELLERAERAGWRDYFGILNDPRWDAVRQEPRFQAIMARVKADIDRQRAVVEAVDREDDFVAVLDAVIASWRAGR